MSNGEESESFFIRHIPCPRCGSRDNNSLFTDGHEHCFGCGYHTPGDGKTSHSSRQGRKVAGLIEGEVRSLIARGITEATCAHFGYMKGKYNGLPVQIAPYYDADGKLVAQKLRFADKSFKWLGTPKGAMPFGATKFPRTGKKIVVTEGEIDALSMSQVQGNKWPVVSISCGAGKQVKKYFAQRMTYFSGFEEVVLMFDQDEPGREATRLAAEVLGERARIAELPLKDANEMLKAGKTEELLNAMWRAHPHRPEGIVDLSSLKEEVKRKPEYGLSYPWESLTKLLFGMRLGEIIAWGAGTGIGKTDLFAQIITHLVREHGQHVGVFSLEQNPKETAKRIAGKVAGKTFHIPDSDWTEDELDNAWEELTSSGKVFLYDSFGNNDWEVIKEKIEYLANAEGVKWFFLDHLTALAAYQDDERKALERIMSDMSTLVTRLGITVCLISHLATPEGRPHEEGGRVMIRHFKGSRAIGFWCHYMLGLERNQQDENEVRRCTTTVRVLKDRYTGRATGECFFIRYDRDTGMLNEVSADDIELDDDEDESPFEVTTEEE